MPMWRTSNIGVVCVGSIDVGLRRGDGRRCGTAAMHAAMRRRRACGSVAGIMRVAPRVRRHAAAPCARAPARRRRPTDGSAHGPSPTLKSSRLIVNWPSATELPAASLRNCTGIDDVARRALHRQLARDLVAVAAQVLHRRRLERSRRGNFAVSNQRGRLTSVSDSSLARSMLARSISKSARECARSSGRQSTLRLPLAEAALDVRRPSASTRSGSRSCRSARPARRRRTSRAAASRARGRRDAAFAWNGIRSEEASRALASDRGACGPARRRGRPNGA